MYVGVVVFGLIAFLAIMAYGALLLAGYEAPPDSPFELLFPPESDGPDVGEVLFTGLAAAFALVFTILAWRRLLSGARSDAAKRRRLRELRSELDQYKRQEEAGSGQAPKQGTGPRGPRGPGGYT